MMNANCLLEILCMKQQKVLSPLRDKEYGGAWSIHDIESVNFIKNIHIKQGNRKKFLTEYKDWIQEGKKFSGLENYKHVRDSKVGKINC